MLPTDTDVFAINDAAAVGCIASAAFNSPSDYHLNHQQPAFNNQHEHHQQHRVNGHQQPPSSQRTAAGVYAPATSSHNPNQHQQFDQHPPSADQRWAAVSHRPSQLQRYDTNYIDTSMYRSATVQPVQPAAGDQGGASQCGRPQLAHQMFGRLFAIATASGQLQQKWPPGARATSSQGSGGGGGGVSGTSAWDIRVAAFTGCPLVHSRSLAVARSLDDDGDFIGGGDGGDGGAGGPTAFAA